MKVAQQTSRHRDRSRDGCLAILQKWIVDSDDDRLYEPVVAPKWIAKDGTSFCLMHSNPRGNLSDRYYRLNVQKVTLSLPKSRFQEC